MSSPKIVIWDLETTNLNADFGVILAFGYKYLGQKKTNVISVMDFDRFKKDPTDDVPLIKEAAKVLADADVWITHYGTYFDVPMINSRLLSQGEKPLPNVPHIDTWKTSRYKLKIHSNRLASIADFFDLDQKTPIRTKLWRKAMHGHKGSLKYINAHCRQDVVVLEQVYNKLKPLMTNHPNLALLGGKPHSCPICGEDRKLQNRGFHVTRTNVYRRVQCQNCGGWSRYRTCEKIVYRPELV